nr:immunoglobulin light chain junction region [Macaca mulatta]MOV96928.1 immunoglobulin light chain junction region [Macaca mulatta]MOV97836.1 immunoglobulin light chain junction region [Macaca mulatta]MOV99166.1 immunoglobulin light chain junction region [Macaca mulatta]MOV99384.1 immunoglobulin light chain junction region [Macaca mulatta]
DYYCQTWTTVIWVF